MKAPAVPMIHGCSKWLIANAWTSSALALFALCALTLTGCGSPAKKASETPKGVEKTFDRGPIKLTLRTSATALTTAETLDLTLSATVDDGYSVSFPEYPAPEPTPAPEKTVATPLAPIATPAAAPSAFSAAGQKDAAPVLAKDGKVTRSRTWHLEPFLAGEYTIPPLSVSYWKEVEGEDKKSTIESEPVNVTVTSVITGNETPDIKEIAGPVTVQNPIPWVLYSVLLLLLVAGAIAAWWYYFVRVVPGPPPPPPVPPHVRALEALEIIQREKLVERGLYKEYYIRVSDVLRHYMEDEFQLRAPERTTEEFLAEIQHNAVLGLQEQLLLRAFLRHCDLVKFAKAEPSSEEIRETFATCEKFIIDSEAAHRKSKAAAQIAAPVEA